MLVLLVSLGAYANSVGNGFAYADQPLVVRNPAGASPTLEGIVGSPYWPEAREGAGLYRPVVVTAFALQWWAFDGSPMGFHAVNVVAHATASVLLLLLLSTFVPVGAAFVGAALFAVHPVHVEAVANVVGQAEIYAAATVFLASLLYVVGKDWVGVKRAARLLAIPALYAVGLGAKEIAVTLPALLVALELVRTPRTTLRGELLRELPVHLASAGVLACYLILRTAAVGTMTGEMPAPALGELSGGERVLTALTAWPEYLRLLLFPLDLSADYSPAVMLPATEVGVDVLLGALLLGTACLLIWLLRRRAPLVSFGAAWFCITVLPVSNLLVSTGVILAERTLYLPSAGLSFAIAGAAALWPETAEPRARAVGVGLAFVVGCLFTVRTTLRNPSWFDSYTVQNTLAVDHPESFVALRSRAVGLVRVGDLEGARLAYEVALELAPRHYGLAVEAAEFYGDRGDFGRAEPLLARTIQQTPDLPEAYILLAEHLIRQGRAREGHRVALAGLAQAGPDERLYALVSESYVAKRDFEGAVRARLAAVGHAPGSSRDWARLAELYEAMGRAEDARAARARAAETS